LHKLPEVESSQVYIGPSTAAESTEKGLEKYNEAHFTVHLKEGTNMDALLERENTDFSSFITGLNAEAKVNMQEGITTGPPQGNNIRVDLYADDLAVLGKTAAQIEQYMRGNGELKNVANNLKDLKSQWAITMNEAGRSADADSGQIARAVSEQLKPVEAGIYDLDGKEWSVALTYREAITSKDELQAVQVPTAAGPKPLGEVADITLTEAPIAIHHQQGRISAQLTADIKGTDTASVTSRAKTDILALTLPKEVEVQIGGGSDDTAESFMELALAMGVSVGLVFLVMSITFGGLLTPLVILSSLLFVPVGAFTGLLVTGQPLSVSAMIGLLMLIGIVVTNAVVLLDRVESNRRAGMELTEAIIEGSKTRLRPILMTACATIFALLPLALSGTSGLISKGLAVTVIGGLTTSTLLTLIVVPVLYAIFGKYRRISVSEKSINVDLHPAQNWQAQYDSV
jgi:multidrug efflux pump subunit AcrB